MISFDQNICGDLGQSLSREWLETNLLGGYACSTISGANTRRYHGLLTACAYPPVGRQLLLSKIEESVRAGATWFELATNQYEGAIHPRGYLLQREFQLDPWPVFTFAVDGATIIKSVFLLYDRDAVVVSYEIVQGAALELTLRPLIAFRESHSTIHENGAIDPGYTEEGGSVRIAPYPGMPALCFSHNAQRVERVADWYRNFHYERERERGLDDHEDLFCPFELRAHLSPGEPLVVIASTEALAASQFAQLRERERARRASVRRAAPVEDDLVRDLTAAADQFIARRGDGYTVMAGYPWFTDWGRDTMISLPGLTLFNGKAEVARGVLTTFAKTLDRGMLPNRFPESGEAPEYNTVDATLWYFEAIRAYVEQTGDLELARELYPALLNIIDWHIEGTRYNIHMLDSGLLKAGESGLQLTWMDAKVGDWVVTPRSGKAVEIQALWYNALRITAEFARKFNDHESYVRLDRFALMLRWSFNHIFWNESAGCLFDVVNGNQPDPTLRPNQIFAVSLGYSMLSAERAKSVVNVVREHLLTPYGLRTLSPSDPKYRGRYEGSSQQRDSVYHQGTVWPWLLGAYVTAFVKTEGNTPAARQQALKLFRAFHAHLTEAGLGQVSEIMDGDPPHAPRGCLAQAWSVAELLRSLCQDVYPECDTGCRPAKK
jgi:predicted glycogen debranching enzyme